MSVLDIIGTALAVALVVTFAILATVLNAAEHLARDEQDRADRDRAS